MSGLKDKLLLKTFEFLRKDLVKRTEKVSHNIEQKYLGNNQLNQTLKELSDDIESMLNENKLRNDKFLELERVLSISEEEVNKRFAKYIEVEKQLTKSKNEYKELKKSLNELEERNTELIQNNDIYTENEVQLRKDITTKKKNLSSFEIEVSKNKELLNSSENRYSQIKNDLDELEEISLKKTEEYQNRKTELLDLTCKLEESEEAKKLLEVKLLELEEGISKSKNDISETLEKISVSSLKSAESDAKLVTCEVALSKLNIERDQLLAKLSELELSQKRVELLRDDSVEQRRVIESELVSLEGEKGRSAQRLSEVKKSYNHEVMKQNSLEELLKASNEELRLVEEELDSKNDELSKQREILCDLERKLSSNKLSTNVIKEDVLRAEKGIDSTKSEIKSHNTMIENSNHKLAGLRDQRHYKLATLEKEKSYLDGLEVSLSRLIDSCEAKSSEIELLNEDILSQKSLVESKKEERRELVARLESLKAQSVDLEIDISDIEDIIQKESARLSRIDNEYVEVKSIVLDLESELEDREDKLLELKVKINKKLDSKYSEQRSIDELYFRIQEVESLNENLTEELGRREVQCDKIRIERERVSKILKLREDSKEKIELKINSSRDKINELKETRNTLEEKSYELYEKLKCDRAFEKSLLIQRDEEEFKLDRLARKKRAMVSKLAETSKSINDLHGELDKSKAQYESEDQLLEGLEEKYASLEMRLVHTRKNSEEISSSIVECRQKRDDLKSKIKLLEEKLPKGSVDLPLVDDTELISLRDEVEQLSETLEGTKARYRDEVSKKKSIANQTRFLAEKRDKIIGEIEAAELELQSEVEVNEEGKREMISLSEEVYSIKKKLDSKNTQKKMKNKTIIRRPSADQ